MTVRVEAEAVDGGRVRWETEISWQRIAGLHKEQAIELLCQYTPLPSAPSVAPQETCCENVPVVLE